MCLYTSLYVEAVLRLYLLTVRVSLRAKKRICVFILSDLMEQRR